MSLQHKRGAFMKPCACAAKAPFDNVLRFLGKWLLHHIPNDVKNCKFSKRLQWFGPFLFSQPRANPNVTAWFNTWSKHHSETAGPNATTTQTCHFHETLRLRSDMHYVSAALCHLLALYCVIPTWTNTSCLHEKSRSRAHPNGRAIGNCKRLQSQKQRRANTALPSDSQVKRKPFATRSGKKQQHQHNNQEQPKIQIPKKKRPKKQNTATQNTTPKHTNKQTTKQKPHAQTTKH